MVERKEIRKVDYKDWLINQSRIPDAQSEEYLPFVDFHRELCLNGCYLGDTFINPFLYWHLNLWHTEIDVIDEYGYVSPKYKNPTLRDNEWIVTNEIYRAEQEHKGLVILGLRRFAKSVMEASYAAHGATLIENSQNVISGLNAKDIKLITDKCDKGLRNLPLFKWGRVEDNWKEQVSLGIKSKSGDRFVFSQILIRNIDNGINEEAIAGTNPSRLIIDEIGKGNFLKALEAAIPGLTTPFGWRASPICTGTGGDMEAYRDAQLLMFDVLGFKFLSYKNEDDERRVHGLFLSNKYRLEAKKPSTLDLYLGKEGDKFLKAVPIQISDEEKANKILEDDIERLKKMEDKTLHIKEAMYYPKKVDDIFQTPLKNIYNIEAAKAQKIRLKQGLMEAVPVELYHDGTQICHKFSEKQIITEFPVKSQSKDAPIQIWEYPIVKPPFSLYVAGVDSYRMPGDAAYSTSLGVVYIYKRQHDILSETFQDMFVACYAARPDDKGIWEEQARLLIKYYNALALVENDEYSFINYMINMGDAQYLVHEPEWIKLVNPNGKGNLDFGVSRQSLKVRNHIRGNLKAYMDEKILTERDDEGSIIKEILGVTRIPDPMLLEETIQFYDGLNVDREIAASLAVTLAKHLNPIYGKISDTETDPRLRGYFNRKEKVKSPFSNVNPFSNRRRRMTNIFS